MLDKKAMDEEATEVKEFKGIIPPVITTFDKAGSFDEVAQREVLRFILPHVWGFYPVGTYGSGPLMTAEERRRVAEVVVDEVGGRVPVIVHVGASSTDVVLELAKHAQQIGADAVAAIPPFYYKYPQEDIIAHYRSLLRTVSIPVFAYNNPGLSNNPLTPKMIQTLADDGLAGLKDSTFDLLTFYEFLETVTNPGFIHIVGTEAIAAAAVQAGAKGVVSGLANAWPELMSDLWQTLETNDGRRAAELQLRVNRARAILKYAPTLVSCHEVLRMRGVNSGYPRRPHSPMTDDVRRRVREAFQLMGLLSA